MSDVAWEIAHSTRCNVSLAFAWKYMTNVANWDDPPAVFDLDGAFEAGSWGTTRLPGQANRRWVIREADPPNSYVIEMALEQATLSFEWTFHRVADDLTRITQRITLCGRNAAAHLSQVRSAFEPALQAGMKRIAAAMERARGGACGVPGDPNAKHG